MNTANINYNTEIFYLENQESCTVLYDDKWLALMLENNLAVLNQEQTEETRINQYNVML